MDLIDEVLERYEEDLKRAEEGKCKKVSRSQEFRDTFRKTYIEIYAAELDNVTSKLSDKNHVARVEERSPEEVFYGFTLTIVPRHLLRYPVDRYQPGSVLSSISFIANEHTLTVDIETFIRPNIEKEESHSIEKIPRDEFNRDLLMQKVLDFLGRVFEETIIIDFKR